jgi:carbonic anhydrase
MHLPRTIGIRFAATVAALTAIASTHAADPQANHAQPHWGYAGKHAAQHWGDLQPDFAACKRGREQSPIDIRGAKKSAASAPLVFSYKASAAEVVNNGHTIQVNLASGGSVGLASGSAQLLQFHFHAPSEEKIAGKSYPLVAHLVHKNAEGQLAVVGVLFKLGKTNPALAKVFAAMPSQAGDNKLLAESFDASDLLPAQRGYYAFMGSLTTPPCSEGVRWQVLKTPVELSRAQLEAFRRLYPMNARPVQPLNGRKIEESMT